MPGENEVDKHYSANRYKAETENERTLQARHNDAGSRFSRIKMMISSEILWRRIGMLRLKEEVKEMMFLKLVELTMILYSKSSRW